MAGPDRIGGNSPRPPPVQPKPVGTARTNLDSAAVRDAAFTSLESGRTGTTSAANQGLLGQGASLVDGPSQMKAEMRGLFSLGSLDVNMVGENGSAFDGSATHTSPQDVHAANSETAARADALAETHFNESVATLTQFSEAAEAFHTQSTKELIEAVGLTLKSNMEKESGEAKEGEVGFKLNGEDGKAFGDFSKLAAQVSSQKGIDLKNMPVEDAVMLLFMLLSEDAKKDVKGNLEEMDATRLKKAALREAESVMKEQLTKIKGQAHDKWDAMPAPKEEFDKWVGTQTLVMPTVKTDEVNGKAVLVNAGGFVGGTDATATDKYTQTTEGGELLGGVPNTFTGVDNAISAIKDKRDSLSEMGEMQQLKMQTYMDRMTKADTANSNLMKKLSDTLNSIISNMK